MVSNYRDMLVKKKVQENIKGLGFAGVVETFDYASLPNFTLRDNLRGFYTQATDYAKLNGARTFFYGAYAVNDLLNRYNNTSQNEACTIFAQINGVEKPQGETTVINGNQNSHSFVDVGNDTVGVRPVIAIKKEMLDYIKNRIFVKYDEKLGKNVEYVTLGEYPQTLCTQEETIILKNHMQPTGKKYLCISHRATDGVEMVCTEPSMAKQKVVQVTLDSTPGAKKEVFKVEPIEWKIVAYGWQNSSSGGNKEEYVTLMAEKAIIAGIPFYPNKTDELGNYWQNSTIRGYLNGYDLSKRASKDVIGWYATRGGDFSAENNFLDEALRDDMTSILQLYNVLGVSNNNYNVTTPSFGGSGFFVPNDAVADNANAVGANVQPTNVGNGTTQPIQIPQRKAPRKNQFGVTVQDDPMSVNEQIKFYIENGKSFMLHGASGVGKTRRVEEADPDFVSIVLRNGILPEEVIGKTIYPNNDKTTGGVWVPPAWYVSLCDKCASEPERNHVLFIDEITNVRPSEQSLVYHLVLNNSIGPNVGKLPQNCVVVAAGNSKEESEAAYNMPEPLFRRFEGHIELKPNIKSWLEWGSELRNGRPKIHPLVASFVATFGNEVFYSAYDAEEPPEFAIDPRGWEQVSNIIYSNNGVIAKELIANKVGVDIASSFVAFAKTPPLSVEDILTDNYDISEIPTQPLQQFSTMMTLRNVAPNEVEKARTFVGKYLDGELLPIFDSIWVGDDSERAIIINDLKNQGNSLDIIKNNN